jgi:acid-sensing ion channel 2
VRERKVPGYNASDILIDIFFDELLKTVIRQEPAYPGVSFFGEVGGQMGLCLGASLLTVAEFMEFFTIACVHCCKKRRASGRVHNIEVISFP